MEPGQQIILFAPTWKGDFYAPTNDIRQLRARIAELNEHLDTSKYRLLLKVHQHVYRFAIAHPEMRDVLVPNDIPTNEVLAATDVLVTDYSSIFVDFLATGRPIVFYAPDVSEYESQRGLYLPLAEWPGPICSELDELADQIGKLGTGAVDDPVVAFGKAYAAARNRYCSLEDGKAAERVVDIVFRGRTEGYNVQDDFSDGRTSILIHLGGMRSNGITASALCLLDNIDYTRYDVSATFTYSSSKERLRLTALINPNVRLLPRLGGINGSKLQVTRLLAIKNRSAKHIAHSVEAHRQLLRDEWVRCYGSSRFDHVVDFSGYAPLWVQVFSQRPSGTLSIWLHNDMRAEIENTAKSAYHRASVAAVSALYQYADHLVSVSPALSDVNAGKFADAAPAEKFGCARNTINYERVLRLAYGITAQDGKQVELGSEHPGPQGELPAPDDSGPVEALHVGDLRGTVARLMEYHGPSVVLDEVERRSTIQLTVPSGGPGRTFVTAGRLSTEKNHERLIRAFDLIHQEYPDTRLIILGSGTLRNRLETVIEELGLTSAVLLAGYLANPYGVLAHSDCFVLSSDYEGQPMVLLEALVLNLPVVTTDFASVRGSMPEGHGRIVARKVDALAKGMREFLRGKVVAKPFDYVGYNREATEEFYHAIGAA
jgi:CDP-glycerol glycerophosphotransferase